MRERAQRRTGSLRYAFRRQSQHLERLKVNRSDIHFPPKHEPLREDVHALGALMGEILREQGGQQLFELVELDRVAAIRGRAGPREARAELAARVRERPPALAREVVRAFSTWFQSVNLAERVHRIRRRREYLLKDSERPQPGGVEDAIAALKSQGLTAAQVLELIGGLSIEPVFAPHSTEASRRTLLRKQQRIAQRLVERLDPTLTPNEARNVWSSIRMELTAAWQTEELPRERLTVADEREQILFYLVEVLYRVVPAFYEEIAQALEKLYGTDAGATRVPAILHVGSWAGGDMDGNPDVHAKSIREALARQQQVIINRYFEECQSIAQRLSQSASRVPAASELTKRVEQYTRLLPGARAITPARHDRMPYRVFLAQLGERLRSTYEGRASGYESARQFRDDVALIAASLRANKGANAGLFYVERLLRRIDTFGFHLATLDVRQHAGVLHEVVARGFDDPLWPGRSSRERRDRLAQALEKDRGPVADLDALGKRHLAVFDAIMQGRHRYGPDAIGYFIVSGASGADDVPRPSAPAAAPRAHRPRRWRRGRCARGAAAGALGRGVRQAHRGSGARPRAAVRDRGGARHLRPHVAGDARGSAVSAASGCARAAPVRADRLLRQQQANRPLRLALHDSPGAARSGAGARQRRRARRHVPRPRRQHRPRRRAHRGPGARRPRRGGGRGAADPRTGRNHPAGLRTAAHRHAHTRAGLQCAEPDDRGITQRAAAARLGRTAGNRRATRAREPRRLPPPGLRAGAVLRVFSGGHADR